MDSGYYIPHRAVIRGDKHITRVRIGYDCSKITEEDREYLKLLRFPENPKDLIQTLHLYRLPFGLTTSPFSLACVLKFHIKKFEDHPKCYEMLNSFLYVDDLCYGANTAREAYELTSTAIEMLKAAAFHLRKLKTNCSEQSNRVALVQALTLPECWGHYSGSDNPYYKRRICRHGGGEQWTTQVNSIMAKSGGENSPLLLLNVNKFSELDRLLRITAWEKRFAHNSKLDTTTFNKTICAEVLKEALRFWIKTFQLKHYGMEYRQLLSMNTVKKHLRIFNLNSEIDEDLPRLKGRLQFSSETVRAKHHLLLPSNDKFVELLIYDAHTKMCHEGVDITLTHLQEQFWIVKGRQYVKNVLNNCLICRRFKVKPGTQVVAPLPLDRIQEHPSFDVCGLDFAGPFFVHDFNSKCYLLIFACAVTRAFHLVYS
ncbi:integrase catalytic domain-containing protein [Nephila pilipes]|uniref:Integrase catalytic domain-containing protein n=1 Tax=Nephila pilipes TaxID=299642 RepID=A0A8X6Q459_NEPPI|nr:integrase catalytic domain-containing protein [Nephila pilipes]